jgi:hypothetical protein
VHDTGGYGVHWGFVSRYFEERTKRPAIFSRVQFKTGLCCLHAKCGNFELWRLSLWPYVMHTELSRWNKGRAWTVLDLTDFEGAYDR